jgi:SNW domain-containing protein 1
VQCHVAQYPLDIGKKKVCSDGSAISVLMDPGQTGAGTTLALQVDSDGMVRYDAIAQHGRAPGSKVQSSFKGEWW